MRISIAGVDTQESGTVVAKPENWHQCGFPVQERPTDLQGGPFPVAESSGERSPKPIQTLPKTSGIDPVSANLIDPDRIAAGLHRYLRGLWTSRNPHRCT